MNKNQLRHPSIIGTTVSILTDTLEVHVGTVRLFANDCVRLATARNVEPIAFRTILDVKPA